MKLVLDSLEDLDASLHEHYEEKDGRFYLTIEDDVRRHPRGASLSAAVDRLKAEKKTLGEKLAELEQRLGEYPDDFDPEEYARNKDELERLKSQKPGDDPDAHQSQKRLYEQRIANLESKHSGEKQQLEEKIQKLDQQIETLVGTDGLTKALVAAGVDKKLMPGATALLRRSVKVRQDEDTGEYRAVVETDIGESSVDEFVQNWAQSDEGSIYLEKPKGGDAPGSNGQRHVDNPWVKTDTKRPNLTRQQQMIRENPEKARALAQAAGVQPNW